MEILRQEILNFQFVDLGDAVAESFKYEGFDAVHIYQLLKSRQQDNIAFQREMNTLTLIGMMRGTRTDKILTSMSQAGQLALNALINRYRLVPTVPRNNRKDAITIGRIMSVFPHICLSHAINGRIRDFGVIEGEAGTMLPVSCRFPQFAALIPSNAEGLWQSYLNWANAMDVVINGDRHSEDSVERFASIANRNTLFTDAARAAILARHGINYV
jgi:hypothetical protein